MSEDNMSQLINTFKTMLNKNNSQNDSDSYMSSETSTQNNNSNQDIQNNSFNISPETINAMAQMLKNSNISGNKQGSSNKENDDNSQNNSTNTNFDFETIMKVKSIMDTLNKKDDPRSKLLYSLKPYLRKTRQEKLEQYVNLLKITQVTDLFNLKKGDKK